MQSNLLFAKVFFYTVTHSYAITYIGVLLHKLDEMCEIVEELQRYVPSRPCQLKHPLPNGEFYSVDEQLTSSASNFVWWQSVDMLPLSWCTIVTLQL